MARTTSKPKTRSTVRSEEYARHFDWVDWLKAKTGKSDAALAKDSGLNVNYIYRKRADGTVLGATQIRMISEHCGLPGPDTYLLSAPAGLADEGAIYDAALPGVDAVTKQMIAIALKGRPNAAPWVLRTQALMNHGYWPGDIVISDASTPALNGDVVVAQVYDLRTGSAETVFRVYEAPYLVAASADPAVRKPLPVDNERVRITGTIIHSFRSLRR